MPSWSDKVHVAKRDLKSDCDDCRRQILKGEKYIIHTDQYAGRWVVHEKCPKVEQGALIIYGDPEAISELAKRIYRIIRPSPATNTCKFDKITVVNDMLNWNRGTCAHCRLAIGVGPRPVHCPKCGRRVDAS